MKENNMDLLKENLSFEKKLEIKNKDLIVTSYLDYDIDEDILIYEGKFTLENDFVKLKCLGNLIFKVLNPNKIIVEAKIINCSDYESLDYNSLSELVMDVHGYRNINVVTTSIKDIYFEGYVSDDLISSKKNELDYADFDVMNLDVQIGKSANYMGTQSTGRLVIEYDKYVIILDRRPDFRREMLEELTYKSGSVITHSGRVYSKDFSKLKSSTLESIMKRLSLALSLINERRVECVNARGFRGDKKVYSYWSNESISDFKQIPNWTSTISNPLNLESFISKCLKLFETEYFYTSMYNVCMWYIESIEGVSIASNIVCIQTALEMLSYIILVELKSVMTDDDFMINSASRNIKKMLEFCNITFDLDEEFFSEEMRKRSASNVDLIVYLRNMAIHPRKNTYTYRFEDEDIWNLMMLGITYIELCFLYIVGYTGEYTNNFLNYKFGDVEKIF